MDFFISDLHIDDSNIIMYEHRPFATLEDMKAIIVKNWNATVTDKDNVYLLGDIGKSTNILNELQGNITVVMGNHDKDIYTDLVKLQQ